MSKFRLAKLKKSTLFSIQMSIQTLSLHTHLYMYIDPGIISETEDIEQFLSGIAQLTASGGGDEPEPSIGAIIRAVRASEQGSSVYVFTDASASDRYRLNELTTLIADKNVIINFVYVTPTGGKKRSVQPSGTDRHVSRAKRQSVDDAYEQLSAISGGQVLTVDTDDISELASFVSFSAMLSRSTVLNREGTSQGTEQFVVPVDTFTSEVFVSVDAEQSISVSVVNSQGLFLSDYSVIALHVK